MAGLREQKKLMVKQDILATALMLFEKNGYYQTTVEQIAEAATVSTTTFYRYFASKEDIILFDDYDAVVDRAFGRRPADEPLAVVVRHAVTDCLDIVLEPDRDEVLARLRWIFSIPEMRTGFARQRSDSVAAFGRALAERTGRDLGDYQIRLAAAVLTEVVAEAIHYWADQNGNPELRDLVGPAVEGIEPLLTALQQTGR